MSDLLERLRFGIKTKPPRPGEVFGEYDIADLERTGLEAADRIEQLDREALEPPSVESAHAMGAKGGPVVEAERLAFEAWMQGHCWALCAEWDGESYRGKSEQGQYIDPRAMGTRRLWAAWRDRAALSAADANKGKENG